MNKKMEQVIGKMMLDYERDLIRRQPKTVKEYNTDYKKRQGAGFVPLGFFKEREEEDLGKLDEGEV